MRRRLVRRGTAGAALVLGVLAVACAAVLTAGLGARAPARSASVAGAAGALPAPVTPLFRPGPPHRLGSIRHVSYWATVRGSVTVRSAPAPDGAVVTSLAPTTPEGTPNVVAVRERRHGNDGRIWVRVRLPVLPNGTTGWVQRPDLGGYGTVRTRLVVDLSGLQATLYRNGRRVLTAPVGVGMPGWPTPPGEFYIRNKLTRYRSAVYGPIAFGTSARSPRATDWPAGGFVGIHGTDRPDLIPGRVSHGCIRLRNADMLALARLMAVGTPVTIR
jgi:lipoprotein-anchoring transpeptidase ErfK/SrfK